MANQPFLATLPASAKGGGGYVSNSVTNPKSQTGILSHLDPDGLWRPTCCERVRCIPFTMALSGPMRTETGARSIHPQRLRGCEPWRGIGGEKFSWQVEFA